MAKRKGKSGVKTKDIKPIDVKSVNQYRDHNTTPSQVTSGGSGGIRLSAVEVDVLDRGRTPAAGLNLDPNTKDDHPTLPPTRNEVEWLSRDPVTGEERIRITVAGGKSQEYNILDKTHLPVRILHLMYLHKMETVIRSVRLDHNDFPIQCNCDDYMKRHRRCKHLKALTVALPKRPEKLHFE